MPDPIQNSAPPEPLKPLPKLTRTGTAALIAAAIAIPMEGLRQVAYYDPPGILTVCYGTTGPDVVKGKVYTIDQCKSLLKRDMLESINQVETCAPGLPAKTLAAFGDAVYNLGPKIVCNQKVSTLARMLAAKDYYGACNQLRRWDRASVAGIMVPLPGLTKRRGLETDLCLRGLNEVTTTGEI